MLEAFQSLQEELTSKKQIEVDQTSASASKPGTSSRTTVNLDLPPPRHRTTIKPRIWMWTMVSDLTLMIHRIRMLLHLSYLRGRSRINPKNTANLAVVMKLNPGLPWINLMRNPMNLGSHLLNLKSTLIRVNTNQGPDMCHLPQRRISPL